MTPPPAARLLTDLLPGVSRSFALSLRVLPATLRAPFGVTYLVARAADTIADTRVLPPAERRGHIEALRLAIQGDDRPMRAGLADLGHRVARDHAPAERRLLERLPEILAAHRALPEPDRARAATVLATLTQAMIDALDRFPPEGTGLGGLATRADLDRYTYMNAGCVGEYWTNMVAAHRPACARWNLALMRARGIRFGQALQLVNVLRDLPRDLRLGRSYLPEAELAAVGLTARDLLAPVAIARLRPLLGTLIDQALSQFEDALAYTLALPRREARLRIACALPLLIGLSTLARLRQADNLLDPDLTVKIPRALVRRHLAAAALLSVSNRSLGAYARRLAAAARTP